MEQEHITTKFEFDAIGTKWIIDIYSPVHEWSKDTLPESLLEKIKIRIAEYDKNYSRFRTDSLVTKMSLEEGIYVLPEDAKPLFDLYEQLYKLTKGTLTVLIGHTMEEAGYDASYSLVTREMHKPPTWSDALVYKFPTLTLKQKVLLDVGALGKGYLIDIVSDLLLLHGIKRFCVDAGGDLICKNLEESEKLRVGLEDPRDVTKAIGIVELQNRALCGSAGNRRTWGDFHHIINPHTLTSPRNILATWVIAETALLADGLASALFFTDPAVLTPHYNFEYAMLIDDGSVKTSSQFSGELFYQQ